MRTPSEQKEHLFNKYFILVMIFTLISQASSFVVSNLITKYADVTFSSTALGGLLVLIYSIAALSARFFTGYLTDRYGRRILLIISSILLTLSTFFLGVTGSIAALLIIRFLMGALYAGSYTVSATASADTIPKSKLSFGTGLFWSAISGAAAIGGFIAAALSNTDSVNFQVIFNGSALGYLLATIIIAFARYETDQDFQFVHMAKESRTAVEGKGLSRFLRRRRFLLPSTSFSSLGLALF